MPELLVKPSFQILGQYYSQCGGFTNIYTHLNTPVGYETPLLVKPLSNRLIFWVTSTHPVHV